MRASAIRTVTAVAAFALLGSCGAKTGLFGGKNECAFIDAEAALAPLDVFLMLDASGSMAANTETGVSKWQAVREALETFFVDPESSGIGATLAFFPVENLRVPELCAGD